MCKEQKRRCSFLLLNHRLYYLSISSGRFLVLPIRQKKARKSFLFCTLKRIKRKKFQFFSKILNLPLYKIKISGIIIIVRCASVAQSVEQGTENPRVIGSIPIGGTSQETQQGFQYAAVAHLVERHLAKVEVASSSLVGRSIMEQQSLFQYGPVAQLVRAPACHAGGRRFEPDPGRHIWGESLNLL